MSPQFAVRRNAGYSLPDILIASVILGIGVMAAASLTFSMNTQEEIATRVGRGASMVENAVRLYSLGVNAADAVALIPTDPHVTLSAGAESTETVAGDLVMWRVEFTATINTVDDVGSWSPGYWTGGGDGAAPRQRTITLRAYRSSHQLRMDQ